MNWNNQGIVRGALVLVLSSAHLAWAGPAGELLSLKIATPVEAIRDSNLALQVTMTNRSPQPMTIIKSNPGCDFSADVRDAAGSPVPLTTIGAELSHCANRLTLGRWIRVTLKPGQSTDETYPIDLYYGLPRPGVYRVQLSRTDRSGVGQAAQSNEVVLNLAE